MSAAMVLPMVWATAAPLPEVVDWHELPEVGEHKPVVRGMAFYRRYTEAILRRYVKMSMEAGRAPSLLGREMFRGKVTSYRVHSFEDVVIFVHDVEKCLAKLDIEQRQIVERVALGLKLSEAIAADALLPQTALNAPGDALANLQQLQVVSSTGTALQLDAGMAPPAGGGFEVRRRDWDFGPGVDQDLVLRSPVRSFSIPREGQVERYYVRMFDASTPPVYSRFSSAVFTNLPVS
jgi:hypothetical protein